MILNIEYKRNGYGIYEIYLKFNPKSKPAMKIDTVAGQFTNIFKG